MPTTEPSSRQRINPPGTESFYETWQFSQATRVGAQVWTAGQIGIGPDGRPGDSLEAQAHLAFQNLDRVLQAAGGSLDDIVELVTYHLAMEDLQAFAAVKAQYLAQDFPPWTVVGVNALALPELLIEVKATAIIGSGAGAKGGVS